ncbi:hypothetical protein LTR53_018964, partial [Teratosphaeriaceae sp. CCFEE 6253]
MQERLIGNIGPVSPDAELAGLDSELDPKDVRKLVIRDKRSSVSSVSSESSEKKAGSKKRVSFAEELDVAEPGSPPLKAQRLMDEEEAVTPVADVVAERRTSAASHSMPKGTPVKASRFMKADGVPTSEAAIAAPSTESAMYDDGTDDNEEAPRGPPGKTLADKL